MFSAQSCLNCLNFLLVRSVALPIAARILPSTVRDKIILRNNDNFQFN